MALPIQKKRSVVFGLTRNIYDFFTLMGWWGYLNIKLRF
jgi:hypothetical protein